MKIVCLKTVAIAWEGSPEKAHVQLYKDGTMDVDDCIGRVALENGFAELVKAEANVVQRKMKSTNHDNKMMSSKHENKGHGPRL